MDIRNCMANPEITDQNDQHPIVMNSIRIIQQGNLSKESRKERRQLSKLICWRLDYIDNNDPTIIDMILINIIERENKRKYINIPNETDRMEGHRIQSYFQPKTETLPQILKYPETGTV